MGGILDNPWTHHAVLFGIDMGIQMVGWAFSVYFRTEKFYDFAGKRLFKLAPSVRPGSTFRSVSMND